MEDLYAEDLKAPKFIIAGSGEGGEPEMEEYDEPWERLDTAVRRVARNVNAVALLAAEGRLDLIQAYLENAA